MCGSEVQWLCVVSSSVSRVLACVGAQQQLYHEYTVLPENHVYCGRNISFPTEKKIKKKERNDQFRLKEEVLLRRRMCGTIQWTPHRPAAHHMLITTESWGTSSLRRT